MGGNSAAAPRRPLLSDGPAFPPGEIRSISEYHSDADINMAFGAGLSELPNGLVSLAGDWRAAAGSGLRGLTGQVFDSSLRIIELRNGERRVVWVLRSRLDQGWTAAMAADLRRALSRYMLSPDQAGLRQELEDAGGRMGLDHDASRRAQPFRGEVEVWLLLGRIV